VTHSKESGAMSSKDRQRLARKLYSLVPDDGEAIGNQALHHQLSDAMRAEVSESAYLAARDLLVAAGRLVKGKGRGGSVRRATESHVPDTGQDGGVDFLLAVQEVPQELPFAATSSKPAATGKATLKAKAQAGDPQVLSYRHTDKRKNNPEVGMVTPESDPDEGKTRWAYDPHLSIRRCNSTSGARGLKG
jgi:adenine-specific DNA-methyltransferase